MNVKPYLDPLPQDKSLCIFLNDELFYSSKGKWLHPLFDFEKFLREKASDAGISDKTKNELSAHDTAVGKAAAFLMTRCGITKIHANLASKLAVEYIDFLNKKGAAIDFTYDTLIDHLQCKTEEELASLFNEEEMYALLQKRLNAASGR